MGEQPTTIKLGFGNYGMDFLNSFQTAGLFQETNI
jgi:hypothetical protein